MPLKVLAFLPADPTGQFGYNSSVSLGTVDACFLMASPSGAPFQKAWLCLPVRSMAAACQITPGALLHPYRGRLGRPPRAGRLLRIRPNRRAIREMGRAIWESHFGGSSSGATTNVISSASRVRTAGRESSRARNTNVVSSSSRLSMSAPFRPVLRPVILTPPDFAGRREAARAVPERVRAGSRPSASAGLNR